MTIVTASIKVKAPVEAVWRFVTHHENFEKYIPGYRGGEIVSQAQTGLGTVYRWYTTWLGLRITTVESIVQWVENRSVCYEGQTAGVRFRSELHTQPLQPGTRLTARIEYEVPWWLLGSLVDRLLVRPRIESEIRASLNNAKRILQSDFHE